MSKSIEPIALFREIADIVVIDVRKDPAREASGLTLAAALRRDPFQAERWWPEFKGRRVVVFCVHGHEVSQGICSILADKGVETRYLDGGLEAWRLAGLPVVAIA
jgi:thiosulfate sulfurtransferase